MEKRFKILFLPLIYILFAALISQNLINDSNKILIKHINLSADNLQIFKISAGFISLIPSLILIALSCKHNIKKIIHLLYGFSAITAFLFFFVVQPNSELFAFPIGFTKSITPFLDHDFQVLLANHWHTIIFYSLSTLWPSGMVLAYYGYMNDVFTFRNAAKYYPLFGVLALLSNIFINPLILSYLKLSPLSVSPNFPGWLYSYGTTVMFFLTTSYLCYLYIFKKGEGVPNTTTTESNLTWKYTAGVGILAGISGIIIMFSKTIWSYNANLEFLNHRRFMRSRRPERIGKSPKELLTAESHSHWLELLGYSLFRKSRQESETIVEERQAA